MNFIIILMMLPHVGHLLDMQWHLFTATGIRNAARIVRWYRWLHGKCLFSFDGMRTPRRRCVLLNKVRFLWENMSMGCSAVFYVFLWLQSWFMYIVLTFRLPLHAFPTVLVQLQSQSLIICPVNYAMQTIVDADYHRSTDNAISKWGMWYEKKRCVKLLAMWWIWMLNWNLMHTYLSLHVSLSCARNVQLPARCVWSYSTKLEQELIGTLD